MKKFFLIVFIVIVIVVLAYFIFYFYSMRNVKSPSYQVVSQAGRIEVRRYPAILIAEVTVTGDRKTAISRGFRLLARFIFGHNTTNTGQAKIAMTSPVMQQSQKITMTSPVIQQSTPSGQQWVVQFVMPKKYTLDDLPRPLDKKIRIIERPAAEYVVLRFSGTATNARQLHYLGVLNQYVKQHGLKVIGEPLFAFYNPPWTLPFMRRNEVMYRINSL